MLMLAGGATDPQISRFQIRLGERGIQHLSLLHGVDHPLPLIWDIDSGALYQDERAVSFSAAFVRQDVFRFLETNNKQDRDDGAAWKVLIDGVLRANPSIRMFNRGFAGQAAVNKPLALIWAREVGFSIPSTVVHASKTQAEKMLQEPTVYKPITGGDMCRSLEAEPLSRVKTKDLKRPYIFQERLEAPELRVFRVGERLFGFDVAADALDYRTVGGDAVISPVDVPQHLVAPMMALTDKIGLSYGAADFKMSPKDGKFRFLEVNSNPMFAGFDEACDGRLIDAMIDYLI